jgi:nitrate/TMAO reductase-like tetraheme cytochrome c subunit
MVRITTCLRTDEPDIQRNAGTVVKATQGTNGDSCIRCHNAVGMKLGEDVFMSNIDRHPTAREGITCIVCHRLDQSYGKLSGRLHV